MKSEDFLVEFLFSLHGSVELDDALYGTRHTVSILSVGNVKRRSATLDFAREKWLLDAIGCDKQRLIEDAANKRVEPIQLLLCEGRSSKSHGTIQLRSRTLNWNATCPGFVDILD